VVEVGLEEEDPLDFDRGLMGTSDASVSSSGASSAPPRSIESYKSEYQCGEGDTTNHREFRRSDGERELSCS